MSEEKKKRKRRGQRKDGMIQLSLQIGRNEDGSPLRKYFYGRTRAEAERKRQEFAEHLAGDSNIDQNVTVKQWVDVFLSTYRTKVNEAYKQSDAIPYKRLARAIGSKRVVDVREADLQRELNELAGTSFSNVDKYRQAMKRLFERARRNKIISENPAEYLTMPDCTKGTHRCLERWEVDLILQHWNDYATHAGLWMMLMLLCGLRRGEMMALRWENVNLEQRTLDVREVAVVKNNQITVEERAKTDAGIRTLPICQALYDALCTVPPQLRSGFVCTSARGAALSESAAKRGLEGFCTTLERILNGEPTYQAGRRTDLKPQKADRKKFVFQFHDLRHTYATALYDAGVPVKAAQYFLGHADVRMTLDLYTHLSRERESMSRNQLVTHLDQWIDDRTINAWNYPDENSVYSLETPQRYTTENGQITTKSPQAPQIKRK